MNKDQWKKRRPTVKPSNIPIETLFDCGLSGQQAGTPWFIHEHQGPPRPMKRKQIKPNR